MCGRFGVSFQYRELKVQWNLRGDIPRFHPALHTGSELHTFTIITTRANALVRRIHDRMPVIYDKDMGRQWLEGPFGARAMRASTSTATARGKRVSHKPDRPSYSGFSKRVIN
jgi:SOS response associated peptidase (SRAP)